MKLDYLSSLVLDTVQSTNSPNTNFAVESQHATERICGYVHLTEGHGGLLIGNNMLPYKITELIVRSYNLGMGDFVEAGVRFCNIHNHPVVADITIRHTIEKRFTDLRGIRPNKKHTGDKNEFLLGQRILFSCEKTFDRISHINEFCQSDSLTKMALLVEETIESVEFLQDSENPFDELFLTEVGYDVKKQLLLALFALFSAQSRAASGEHVILFVDNFSKLFRVYNRNAGGDVEIKQSALSDIKTFFMSAKQIKDGGSLTIVGYINKPQSQMEQYLYDEFSDLAQLVL